MKNLLVILLIAILTEALWLPGKAQVSMFSRVKNLPARLEYPVDEACGVPVKKSNGRTGELWIAFSDSDENLTYADPHARRELGKLEFLQPLLVLRKKNGFCKVVGYDKEVIAEGGSQGVVGIPGKQSFQLKNRKKVKYLGWVKEERLLHSTNARVCGHNFKPQKYLTAISHPKMIMARSGFLKKDSVLLAHAPGYRKKAKGMTPLHDWVYIYKKNERPAQYLIGSVPSINPDSMHGNFGWVADSMVLPLGQNAVLLPVGNASAVDSTLTGKAYRYPVRFADVGSVSPLADSLLPNLQDISRCGSSGWALPVNLPLSAEPDRNPQEIRTFFPTELIDLADSRIYNCLGQPFSYHEYQLLKHQLKTVNIVIVFEDGKEGKEALRKMIISFQDLFTHTQDRGMEDYNFNYAAVGYIGRWTSESLSWTKSFAQLLEFIQNQADDKSIEFITLEHVMLRGLQEAASLLKGHEREHNVVITIGSKINATTFPKLFDLVVPELAAVSANLVFLQPERGKAVNYSDMVLQSKRILSEVGTRSRKSREQIIVDNKLVKTKNEFRIDDRCGNGYIYDFPQASMQKGGLFFPAANSSLCPNLLEWVMDTVLRQIRMDNHLILSGMHEKFTMLGRLQQKVNPLLRQVLDDQGVIGLPDSVANTWNDQFFVEAKAAYHPGENAFLSGFMLTTDEFDELARKLRKVVIDPKLNRNGDSQIDFSDRRHWYRELKRIFRERNRYFGKKTRPGKATLAEVIFMYTGFPVNNQYFHTLPIRNVKSRTRVEQEELLPEIGFFYRDIFEMEEFPSSLREANAYYAGRHYYLIPTEILP